MYNHEKRCQPAHQKKDATFATLTTLATQNRSGKENSPRERYIRAGTGSKQAAWIEEITARMSLL